MTTPPSKLQVDPCFKTVFIVGGTHGNERTGVLQIAENSVLRILDVLEAHGRGGLQPPDPRTRIYLHEAHVCYPECGDDVGKAFVHRDLDGRDYHPLEVGMPILSCLNGETLYYEGPEGRSPVFVNEAAYYREGIAFSLTRTVTLSQLMPCAGQYAKDDGTPCGQRTD